MKLKTFKNLFFYLLIFTPLSFGMISCSSNDKSNAKFNDEITANIIPTITAVAALGHDVVIIVGLFSIFAWDFDLSVLAALLAVIGYSLNDSIVVSDRIRENFRSERAIASEELINLSLNQTLSRTIITSLTTLLVLFALFIFGGDMIRGFSQALIIGVLIGTYSSIYVVANMLLGLSITQDDLAIPEPEGAEFDDMP